MVSRVKVLLVYGGGGHTTQMIELAKGLDQKHEYINVMGMGDSFTRPRIAEDPYEIRVPRKHGEGKLISIFRTMLSFAESLWVIKEVKPKAIISIAPGMSVPLSYCAKAFKAKVIFVETDSRVYKQSLTGKLIHPIADQFFVQWEEQLPLYQKAIYAGRLK